MLNEQIINNHSEFLTTLHHTFLNEDRKNALQKFEEKGFPNKKDEEYKYTNLKEITEKDADYEAFREGLLYVNQSLAKQIAGDGEGCTRLFEVHVAGADSKENAKILSKSVVTSSLTKAAIYGKDANWGRILCALGYAGVDFDPVKVDISLKSADGVIEIVKDGIATDYSEDEATKVLSADAVTADIDVHNGVFEATAWGCDLTYEYVKINADYRS